MTTASIIAPLLMTDGYKLDHRRQYPEGTTRVYSNFTNRASRLPGVEHVVHFGLQAFCQKFLVEAFEPFFAANVDEVVQDYERVVTDYLGPNAIGTGHIRALHGLGFVPLRFAAVPEGTLVPLRVPSFTIENTIPEFFWLVNYVETMVSASVWHASTTATIAREYRKLLSRWAGQTSAASAVDYQAHDFSFRGQTSIESAAASGAAHLLSFLGSDSLPALDWIRRYYPGSMDTPIANSVPATEHSVMCAGGQDGELLTFERLLNLYPTGIVSVVSDTWDLWNVLTVTLPALKDKITARDGKLVIRPDSGDPVKIICGDPLADPQSPACAGVIELLWREFGGHTNERGYRELAPCVGAIYGDSITLERADEIARRLADNGFASTNIVFGVGSFTYQFTTRDTFSSAVKATWVEIDGVGRNIKKDPITDSGMKKSATGRLSVLRGDDGELFLLEKADTMEEYHSALQPVWENGKPLVTQSFQDVRRVLTGALI